MSPVVSDSSLVIIEGEIITIYTKDFIHESLPAITNSRRRRFQRTHESQVLYRKLMVYRNICQNI